MATRRNALRSEVAPINEAPQAQRLYFPCLHIEIICHYILKVLSISKCRGINVLFKYGTSHGSVCKCIAI